MSILQAHGIAARTSPYPLAIADIHGNMRSSPKSQLLASLSSCVQFDKVVYTTCSILSFNPRDLGIIIDLLYFIHMPPPPSVSTFYDYFQVLWQQTVGKYVTHHQASYTYIVIDKPESQIPHGKTYSSLLAKCQGFKAKLIEYLTEKFSSHATSTKKVQLLFDCGFTIATVIINNTRRECVHFRVQ